MNETLEQIADRLMAPASTSALWTYDQVRLLLLEATKAGHEVALLKAIGLASDATKGLVDR